MDEIYEVILVEGRYDKHTLANIVRATILETRGYGIFSDRQRLQLLRRIAVTRGLVILTDSDHAGFLIRNRLKSRIKDGRVLHAYIPDRFGKERRKAIPGKEGKLGVEGMERTTLLESLRRAGATFCADSASDTKPAAPPAQVPKLTKTHLYEAGLTGKEDSAAKRRALLKKLDLPENLNTNALLDMLNVLFSYDEALRYLSF